MLQACDEHMHNNNVCMLQACDEHMHNKNACIYSAPALQVSRLWPSLQHEQETV